MGAVPKLVSASLAYYRLGLTESEAWGLGLKEVGGSHAPATLSLAQTLFSTAAAKEGKHGQGQK